MGNVTDQRIREFCSTAEVVTFAQKSGFSLLRGTDFQTA